MPGDLLSFCASDFTTTAVWLLCADTAYGLLSCAVPGMKVLGQSALTVTGPFRMPVSDSCQPWQQQQHDDDAGPTRTSTLLSLVSGWTSSLEQRGARAAAAAAAADVSETYRCCWSQQQSP